jgi:hypothetical protein
MKPLLIPVIAGLLSLLLSSCRDPAPRLKPSEVYMVDAWDRVVAANPKPMGIPDEWMGDQALGIVFDAEATSSRKIQQSLKEQISRQFDEAISVHPEQHHPWIPGDVKYYAVLNTQGKAILALSIQQGAPTVMRISQVIQIAPGMARFPFGDEDLLYAEIESGSDFSYLPP